LVAREQGLVAPGYRLLANVGGNGGQEVPHPPCSFVRRRAARADAFAPLASFQH
jgi:hypothetical protein